MRHLSKYERFEEPIVLRTDYIKNDHEFVGYTGSHLTPNLLKSYLRPSTTKQNV